METKEKYYYAIHVFYSRKNGYTVAIESDRELTDEEAIEQAVKEEKIDLEDARSVDWVDETDKDDFDLLNQ